MFKKIKVLILLVLIIGVGYLVIGGKIFQKKGNNQLDEVSLRLKWIDQVQFTGYYVANSQGLYAKRGLKVEINPGGPDISPVQMVTTGVNDFGITGADQIILARKKGVPLVALAVLYKESPVVMISLKESGIKTPKDFEGKKVAVVYGRDEEIIYRTLLKKANVDTEKIEEVPCMFNASQLIGKEVDAQVGYETNEVVLLNKEGYDLNVIRPRDYDIKFYADTLFTTEEMIEKNPELVRKFVQASIEGWKIALSNPEAAVDEVIKVNSTLDRAHQSKFLEYSTPLITNYGEIGYSDGLVWEEMASVLSSQGLLEGSIDINKSFTNEFLQ